MQQYYQAGPIYFDIERKQESTETYKSECKWALDML